MVKLDSADVERARRRGRQRRALPAIQPLKLGSGLCPVPLFKDRAVNVALGSGGASNHDLLAETTQRRLSSPTACSLPRHRSMRMTGSKQRL